MPTVEERISDVEGQMRLYPQMFALLRGDIAQLRGEMGSLRDELRGEMGNLRDELRGKMGSLRDELRGEVGTLRDEIGQLRGEMRQDFARLDDRMSRQFMWLVGVQVTTLLAVVGALLARA